MLVSVNQGVETYLCYTFDPYSDMWLQVFDVDDRSFIEKANQKMRMKMISLLLKEQKVYRIWALFE